MDRPTIQAALAAIEAQRGRLGDAVTEVALAQLSRALHDTAGAAPEEPLPRLRRAQVTVLFADVADPAALAARLDTEDAQRIVAPLLARAADLVQAHGGRVLRFMGDGLKAAFGTEAAREDDAERALQAGLDILALAAAHGADLARTHGIEGFAMRVGAHTGHVVLGAGVEADQTLTGGAVHIAARLQQHTPPGGLRVSAETWAQVRGRFAGRPQPPLTLKGVAQPMASWLVDAARRGEHARGIDGLAVPMIGRDVELARLGEWLAAGRAVTVLAQAGLGKTRLLREALRDGRRLLRAWAHPSSRLRAWGVLQQWVAAHCGMAEGDDADLARRRLLAGLMPAFADEAERRAQIVGQLLGLDFGDAPGLRGLDGRALRSLGLAALRDWLAWLAAQPAPPLLVVEDLHWADDPSLDALHELLRDGLPLPLLMTARPVLLERRAAWTEAHERIELAPLGAHDSDALAQALLAPLQPPSPRLQALLTGRAEGNPYYMEEIVRRLLDDGVLGRDAAGWTLDEARLDTLRLPATLVGLLQARLDALPPAEHACAQQASIVGPVFWQAALAAVDADAPAQLAALQQRQWCHRQPASTFDDTAEWRFDHHLLHEVTYDTVLKAERQRGHLAVAHWLAQRTGSGREAEFIAITGHHAERGGDIALAVDCYERAARAATARFSNTLATECLQRALRLVPEDEPARRWSLLGSLSAQAELAGDHALQRDCFARMEAWLDAQPDPRRRAALLSDRALQAEYAGDHAAARTLAQQAVALAEPLEDADTASYAHCQLAWLHCSHDEMALAHAHLSAALQWSERVRDSVPRRFIQANMLAGAVALREHDMARAREFGETVMHLAEAHHEPRATMGALDHLAETAHMLAEWPEAQDFGRRMLALAERVGDGPRTAIAHRVLAWAAFGAGDVALAREHAACGALLAAQRGQAWVEAMCLTLGGHVEALAGDVAAARRAFEAARAAYGRLGGHEDVQLALDALIAHALLQQGDRSAAAQHLEAAIAGGCEFGRCIGAHEAMLAACLVLQALAHPRADEISTLLRRRCADELRQICRDLDHAEAVRLRKHALSRLLPPDVLARAFTSAAAAA